MAAQEMENINKIVVVMPNWLGDAVMALPALRLIAKQYPDARVCVMTTDALAPLYATESYVVDTVSWSRSKLDVLRIVKQLKDAEFDMGILMTNSFWSALCLKLGSVKYRVGYAKELRGFLLTHPFKFPRTHRQGHQSVQFLKLLFEFWGLKDIPEISTEILLSAAKQRVGKSLLKAACSPALHGYMAMGIGSAFGPAKDWSAERYRSLGQKLHAEYGVRCLLIGTDKDQEKARFIKRGLDDVFCDLTGQTTLPELMSVLHACRFFVGNDSGLSHVAAALNIVTIVVFGSTNPQFTHPLGRFVEVLYANLECSPCFKRTCPLGTLECMKSIKVDDVMEVVVKCL